MSGIVSFTELDNRSSLLILRLRAIRLCILIRHLSAEVFGRAVVFNYLLAANLIVHFGSRGLVLE